MRLVAESPSLSASFLVAKKL
ncbi:hypothetical protein OCEANICA350_11922 [Oceanicaulis sp. 350]|nr:hypothetical protein OCEANICA350_11922 [Oceanicaulis sp. 350]